MKGLKCPECGLVNLETAATCKRCKYEFTSEQPGEPDNLSQEQAPPPVADVPDSDAPTSSHAARKDLGTGYTRLAIKDTSYGTWLSLFAFFIVVRVLVDFYRIFDGLAFWAGPGWLEMAQPGGRFYDASNASLFYFEQFSRVALITLSVIMLVSFFKKSRTFPRWALILVVSIVAANLIDVLWTVSIAGNIKERLSNGGSVASFGLEKQIEQSIPLLWGQLLVGLSFFLLWFLYLRSSERVRSVFGN